MDENGSEGQNESGGSLRSKLETALESNRELAKQLKDYKAADIIKSKDLKYVTPADLASVDLSEIEAKATEIERTKAEERKNVLKQVFAEQGFSEDEVEDKVAQFLSPPQETVAQQSSRIASLGNLQGQRVANDTSHLRGQDLILAAISEKDSVKNRR